MEDKTTSQKTDKEKGYKIDDILKDVNKFQSNALLKNKAHYAAARKLENYGRNLSIAVSVLSAIVGTSIFTALSKNTYSDKSFDKIRIITGAISVLATALSTLPTIFRFSEKASKHKKSSNDFEFIYNKFASFKLKYAPFKIKATEALRKEAIDEFNKIMTLSEAVSKDSPTISESIYKKIINEMDSSFASVLPSLVMRIPSKF